MKKLLLLLTLLGLCAPVFRLWANPLAEADALYKQRADSAKALKALAAYRAEYAKAPANAETGWRVAMACYFAGIRLAKKDDEKEKYWAEGRDAGEAAVKAAGEGKCAPCHFWTAINKALYGQSVGVFKMFFSLPSIRDHLEKTVAADPTYAYSGAYRLLGLIEQKLPGILGGSDDRAKEYFEKAIKTTPDEPLNYLFLARLLKENFDEPQKALELASQGLGQPEPAPDRLESIDARADLKRFIVESQQQQAE